MHEMRGRLGAAGRAAHACESPAHGRYPRRMTVVHRVEVRTKDGVPDARGAALLRRAIAEPGLPRPTAVGSAQVYLIEGDLPADALRAVASQLLAAEGPGQQFRSFSGFSPLFCLRGTPLQPVPASSQQDLVPVAVTVTD